MKLLRQIFQRKKMTYDLSEEMRHHLEEKIESFVAAGMPREEAVHAAHRAFGNATLIEQRSREIWMWPFIESLWADIKFAFRQLRKSPGFALTVIATGKALLWHGKPIGIFALPASTDFFSMLGAKARIGRTFDPADLNNPCTLVLAYPFWKEKLGAPATPLH